MASSSFPFMMVGDERVKRDLEKRRRSVEANEALNDEAGSLNLKLGGHVFPVMEREVVDKWDEKSGKKTKVSSTSSTRAVCQVDDCKADLSSAKDYHRRHKVCEVHSKATRALVGNVVQRFCQQCSRFHVLQEFDEGKRSCRRRLAGHNKRRRKTHPENVVSATSLNDEQGSNYLLISLLRILSNLHTSSSDQTKDQDLLSHLLRNLAGSSNEKNTAGLLPVSQDLQNVVTSLGTALKDSTMPAGLGVTTPSPNLKNTVRDNAQAGVSHNGSASQQSALLFPENASNLSKANASDTTVGRTKLNNIDLNNVYDDSQDCIEDPQDNVTPENLGNVSAAVPFWLCKDLQQSSPPHNSGNSGSTQSHSPSTSSGEAQSRTDRIVFKLFGKDPSDFPLALRKQILDWLSSSPTDIESYIRPGLFVLTIYLCMDKSTWDELYHNLNSTLGRLLESSAESFWRTGWIYTRVQHRATFVYNGQVVLDAPFPLNIHQSCRISSIKPIAAAFSESVHFVVKGFKLSRATSRLLCALEGKYLVQENCADTNGAADSFVEHEEIQCLRLKTTVSAAASFHSLLQRRMSALKYAIWRASLTALKLFMKMLKVRARDQALDFVHEMGWLLHKNRLIFRLGASNGNVDPFSFKRFRWLIEFAVDHDWCAVVKKLLNILLGGTVDSGQHTCTLVALLEVGLLHRAVRRNSSLDSSENVLDALTEDPGSVGIEAWKKARDSSGLTPHDYACLRGHYSYVHLVQRKLKKKAGDGQVVVDIPGTRLVDINNVKQKIGKASKWRKLGVLETEKGVGIQQQCRECEQKLSYGRWRASVTIYRPAMVSMVAIAAVCVCAALLFKSSPEVLYSFRPFELFPRMMMIPPISVYLNLGNSDEAMTKQIKLNANGGRLSTLPFLLFPRISSPHLHRQTHRQSPTPHTPYLLRYRSFFIINIEFAQEKALESREYPVSLKPPFSQFSTNNKKRTPIKNIKKKLDKKNNAKAWANTVTEALSDAIDKKQWLRALQVFEMLKAQPFYQPKEGTYMKLLVLLGRCGQPGQAYQLFDEMLEQGLEPTAELYTALVAACCRSNLIDKAFAILEQMKSLPLCQPDVYTYSILIKACVDACRFELVESLYDEMAERLITPNTVTQNIVLSGYGKAGKYEEMEKVLSRMLESTTSKPDVWTMNTIISLFGNEGQIEMMERWYEKFRNYGIEPETRTFNILIGAYGKKRMYDKMSSVMEYMRRLSFPWTTSTYNNVIEAFSDAVISSVQLAGRLEIPENTSFFNAVIYACSRAEDLMEMERVFKRMKDKLCQPDCTTYSMMMDAYRKEGMSDKVYDLEQEMQMMTGKTCKEYHDVETDAAPDAEKVLLI
ncbi:UNVERIFIED_CONTAM: Squamosa promoter-binding-like protein 1 [Sesamum radiatum]|uniref:Squamosa promoter-binding-like protein 1 n=1 Tax=Sesamum radiatum TaxID=300843 RepID=A0AAW2QJ75_SESRA